MSVKTPSIIVVIALVGASGYGFYEFGMRHGMQMASNSTSNQAKSDPPATSAKQPLYWYDPMYPQQKFDKPGKSPFMDMQLVAMYPEGDADQGKVSISPRVAQNLGVRTAKVVRGVLRSRVEAIGSVAYNERDVAVVQARSNGYLEKLYVRAPLDSVHQGQALAALYVPDWVAAQEEYLSAKRLTARAAGLGLDGLRDGARQRMRLAGMSDAQIRLVDTTHQVQARLTVTAPRSGVVTELAAREGMTVMAGAALFRINGLTSVWVNAEVPEAEAGLLTPDSAVTARAAAYPGQTFTGKVGTLLPEVNMTTRTLKVRIELANPRALLKPGMFVTVSFAPTGGAEMVLVPTEAIIQTGTRAVVIVTDGDKFAPVDVELGQEAGGQTEIRKGLTADQTVVISGQFLIDSEASLKASVTRMSDAPPAPAMTSEKKDGMAEPQ
ncbi:MAG: efflux RND transporter periplasmic adaptor subunit [Gammaproteobacteria bacterium]|nr:efflux RND transporter periplasmic adaptor subunit [Gammaproteobacteria bacterium]